MSLVYPDMQLSEVVEEYPSLIPVIHRFGIRLGLGDEPVEAICRKQHLDTDFFLTMINMFLNEDYFPEKKMQRFHISLIIDYLTKTNHYYQRHQLPNIEHHLRPFISMSHPDNHSLALIGRIFDSFKDELTKRIEKDEKEWFPYCMALSARQAKEHILPLVTDGADEGEDAVEALLADLRHIMIRHLTGEYDENLCHAVIFSVSTLSRDIKQHNRIRYRILQTMVAGMEHNGL